MICVNKHFGAVKSDNNDGLGKQILQPWRQLLGPRFPSAGRGKKWIFFFVNIIAPPGSYVIIREASRTECAFEDAAHVTRLSQAAAAHYTQCICPSRVLGLSRHTKGNIANEQSMARTGVTPPDGENLSQHDRGVNRTSNDVTHAARSSLAVLSPDTTNICISKDLEPSSHAEGNIGNELSIASTSLEGQTTLQKDPDVDWTAIGHQIRIQAAMRGKPIEMVSEWQRLLGVD